MSFASIRRPLVSALAAASIAGCHRGSRGDAAGSPPETDPLAAQPWRPAVEHQQCTAVEPKLGTVAELADSAALVRAIAEVAPPLAGHALWTIAFDDSGAVAEVRTLESTYDHATQDRLRGAVAGAVRAQAEELYVRLRLDVGTSGEPRLRTGGVQYCQATLLNVDAVRIAMGAINREGVVELELYIDELGYVQGRTVKLSSGDVTTDRAVLGIVAGMQYAPARLERVAVPARLFYRVDLD